VRLTLFERLGTLEARLPQPGVPAKPLLPDWVLEAALQQGIPLPDSPESAVRRAELREPTVAASAIGGDRG
jgi:hypothetical protein